MKKRFLITGGFGYIGTCFAIKALKRGDDIHLYDSLIYEQDQKDIVKNISETSGVSITSIKYTIGDTRNEQLFEKIVDEFEPTHIMHWGDLSSVYSCNHNPRLTDDVCLERAKFIIDLCTKKKIRLFINSSSSVYGVQKEKVLVKEDGYIPKPTDLYTAVKLKIEEYIGSNKYVTCFRPATVFGIAPRFRIELLPNHFAWMAVKHGVIKVADLNAYRAAIHIDDLTNAYLLAADKETLKFNIYNIGSINLSKLEFALGIQKNINCRIETIPDFGDLRNLQIDSSRFNNELGFTPELDFSKSIQTTIQYLEKNKEKITKENFTSMLNMPLANWERISK